MRPAGPKTGGQRPHVLEIDPGRSNGLLKTTQTCCRPSFCAPYAGRIQFGSSGNRGYDLLIKPLEPSSRYAPWKKSHLAQFGLHVFLYGSSNILPNSEIYLGCACATRADTRTSFSGFPISYWNSRRGGT